MKVVFFSMALRQSGRAWNEKLPAHPSPREPQDLNENSRKCFVYFFNCMGVVHRELFLPR
jgi:hypothetical protein